MLFQYSAKIISLDVLRAKAMCIDHGEDAILLAPYHWTVDQLGALTDKFQFKLALTLKIFTGSALPWWLRW